MRKKSIPSVQQPVALYRVCRTQLSRPWPKVRIASVSLGMNNKSIPSIQHPVTLCRVYRQRRSRPQVRVRTSLVSIVMRKKSLSLHVGVAPTVSFSDTPESTNFLPFLTVPHESHTVSEQTATITGGDG